MNNTNTDPAVDSLNIWQRFRKHYWWALLFDATVLLLVFISIGIWQARDLLSDSGNLPAPGFSLPDRQGNIISLEDYRGKRVVVYFFAPWCKVCSISIHNLVDITADRDPDLVILALGVEYESAAEVWEFADHHKLQMPVLLGTAKQVEEWQIKAFPSYYVLNEQGIVIARSIGYSTELGIRWRARER